VQLSSGRDRAAADQLVTQLEAAGFAARVLTVGERGETFFKVRVGGFATDERVRRERDELEMKGFSGGWIIEEP
jgi:cell division protein FtsN